MTERGPITRAHTAEQEARRLRQALERIAAMPETTLAYAHTQAAREALEHPQTNGAPAP